MLYACPMTLWPDISRDLRNCWSILDPVSSWGQEMLVWLPSSYSVAVSAVFTVHCLLSKTHGSELTALITVYNHKTNEERSTFGKSMVFEMAQTAQSKMRAFLQRISHHNGYAWLCQGDQAQARKGGGLNPQQIPMTSFHQNRGAPCSLTLDFPGTQTSASNFWWRSQKKNHPSSTTQRGGQTKAEDQPQWLTKDEAPTIPNSVLIIEFTTCKFEAPNSIECVATSTMNDVNRTRQRMHRTATHGRDLQLNSITDVLSQSYESKHV